MYLFCKEVTNTSQSAGKCGNDMCEVTLDITVKSRQVFCLHAPSHPHVDIKKVANPIVIRKPPTASSAFLTANASMSMSSAGVGFLESSVSPKKPKSSS